MPRKRGILRLPSILLLGPCLRQLPCGLDGCFMGLGRIGGKLTFDIGGCAIDIGRLGALGSVAWGFAPGGGKEFFAPERDGALRGFVVLALIYGALCQVVNRSHLVVAQSSAGFVAVA